MLQKAKLYRGIGQLFIAGLLSSVYATQTFALGWMNQDSRTSAGKRKVAFFIIADANN